MMAVLSFYPRAVILAYKGSLDSQCMLNSLNLDLFALPDDFHV